MSERTAIQICDVTLRDGNQGEGINLSSADKVNIAKRLDQCGFHYIEGGWPMSNPKDAEFFEQMQQVELSHARICAFGMTRRKNIPANEDANLLALVKTGAQAVTLVGKSWDLHVTEALKIPLQENLDMITDSIQFLKSQGLEVIYDAEHFFDGFKHNEAYALATLKAAEEAGADVIVLCDTNGGSLPDKISQIVQQFCAACAVPVGIHVHNDRGLAVANTLAAVVAGATHVQGTINGIGERCGNADLIAVIANLSLQMGYETIGKNNIRKLTDLSRYVYETANLILKDDQPFVGQSAFAHKGGLHVSAVQRNPLTYEHIDPEAVGNVRRILISELSGRATLLAKIGCLDAKKDSALMNEILDEVQKKENEGYHFEAAEASFDLLVQRHLGKYKPFFARKGFRVTAEKRGKDEVPVTEATCKIEVDGQERLCVAEGDGPVDALAAALRQAIEPFYPELAQMHLIDYKVRIINARAGTAAKVRVIIESRDAKDIWSTIGVSENIIEASWIALVDSVEYKLMKNKGDHLVTG